MGVLRDGGGCCWCAVGGRSERVKSGVFSGKGPAMVAIFSEGGSGSSTGFLIHGGLLLTTHANIPSAAAAEAAEIQLHNGWIPARLSPQRFFIASSVLDLTIVGVDILDSEPTSQVQQPRYLKTSCNTNLSHGSTVYFLGYTDQKELVVGEGKVVIMTDNLIKFSTDASTWYPGSAGFDTYGNLAFMVCDPMKLSSPTAKSSSASGSSSSAHSWKKDSLMQFGVPIPIICDWLHQHWEGSLDDISKPKLSLIRLKSIGHRSELSSASFTQKQVFKSTDDPNCETSSCSQFASGSKFQAGSSSSAHEQGIPTPEIYESPKLTAGALRKTERTPAQLLDINFPPRNPKSVILPLPLRQLLPDAPNESDVEELRGLMASKMGCRPSNKMVNCSGEEGREANTDCCSEVQSSSPPLDVSDVRNCRDGFSSEGETFYSAETMESRNCPPSPRRSKFQQVRRSHSFVDYTRWSSTNKSSATSNLTLRKQHGLASSRKMHSQAVPTAKGQDYCSPTVSSSMKRRKSSEQQKTRPRNREVQVSPRWNF